ncbi:MAG: hypothetical protein ACPLRH_03075 [Desulfotomaculales bacterium]
MPMGTRGAYGFRIDGMDKVTYNHSDSYPSWLGNNIVVFIKSTPHEKMVEAARRIILVNADSKPTPDQIEECKKYADLTVSKRSYEDWYCLLRDAQGDLNAYLDGLRYMIDDRDFLADSSFCLWAYIVNLDEKIFEVYRGCQKERDKNPRNRYRNMEKCDEKYYPVKLVAEFPLDGIPDDWIEQV